MAEKIRKHKKLLAYMMALAVFTTYAGQKRRCRQITIILKGRRRKVLQTDRKAAPQTMQKAAMPTESTATAAEDLRQAVRVMAESIASRRAAHPAARAAVQVQAVQAL